MEEDSKYISLLDESIETEFNSLTEQRRIFDISLQELEKTINSISYKEPSSIQQIKNKFEEIQKQMKNMNDSISYIKNFLKKNADDKFKNALKNLENDVQNQIEKNLSFENDNVSNESQQEMEIDTSLNQKNKIERLKNLQKEYKQIYDITVSLSKLSQDINSSLKRSENKVNNIEDNLIIIEDNTKKANDELREFRDNNNNNNSIYIKFSLILFILILIIGYLTYSRLMGNNNNNGNISVNNLNKGVNKKNYANYNNNNNLNNRKSGERIVKNNVINGKNINGKNTNAKNTIVKKNNNNNKNLKGKNNNKNTKKQKPQITKKPQKNKI